MPTSSIFTTVRITDPKKAEAFIDALDEQYQKSLTEKPKEIDTSFLVTDPKKIRKIMSKRFPELAVDDDDVDEDILEERKEIAIRLLGKLSLEEIAEAVKLDIETVRELAREKEHS